MKRKRRRPEDLRLCCERNGVRQLLLVENRIPLVDAFFLGCEERVGGIEDFDLLDGIAHANRVHDVLAFGGDTKHRVASIQVRCGHMGDEKLAAIGSRARIRHGEHTGFVVLEAGFYFVLEAVAWAAASCAGGVATLDHELRDDAVEGDAVVVTAFCEVQEIRNGYRCGGWLQCGLNRAFAGVNNNTDVLHGGSVCR